MSLGNNCNKDTLCVHFFVIVIQTTLFNSQYWAIASCSTNTFTQQKFQASRSTIATRENTGLSNTRQRNALSCSVREMGLYAK
ncbi:hypothetical protein SAICODRAFT_32078 [Saitoella complicata NRRL Y-17804]|uniref:uncharacterized protein n=1 Tax=Saitoella complicata (strain BCRC 22490 / CBS 7301 / JCM 7358 / NBRC 10748 / NRRL Y-17804) TaxID=698492 RepID=UPI000866D145|nr:uncharacterized protein SAICODRAFT_32078 [Saitoella complicata NRRL Y-17804]ODQ50092.1 hypothetical protein SAICODRAFT_32078 [Saitoella complicata NRRL Y-17804]